MIIKSDNKSLKMSPLILLFLIKIYALSFLVDMRYQRLSGFSFCEWNLNNSHSGYPPVQPSKLWSNITLSIPPEVQTIQITSYSRNNRTVTSSVSSRITYLEEHRRDLKIGLEYWSEPFTVYIGFYPSKCHREEKLCEEK